jgi:hypothetical protein
MALEQGKEMLEARRISRSEFVATRLSPFERELAEMVAQQKEQSLAALIREALMGHVAETIQTECVQS